MNDALARCEVPPWQSHWDSPKFLSGLLRIENEQMILQEMLRHVHDPQGVHSFWASEAVPRAHGLLVGVLLVKLPQLAGGPLQWLSSSHRFWVQTCSHHPTETSRRLCFLEVVDACAIGPFCAGLMSTMLSANLSVRFFFGGA